MGSHGQLQLSSSASNLARGPLRRAALVALAAALGFAALFSPVKLCLLALTLHIPCPGCGMTRATVALMRGDLAQAVALHPLSPFVVPFATGLVAVQTVGYVRTGAAFGTGQIPRWIELAAAALASLLVGIWFARFLGFFGGPVSLR